PRSPLSPLFPYTTLFRSARFEFSLRELGGGRGRGYLHWKSHPSSQNWTTLDSTDREVARLQESVPWWIPPAGFAYAMTPDGVDEDRKSTRLNSSHVKISY